MAVTGTLAKEIAPDWKPGVTGKLSELIQKLPPTLEDVSESRATPPRKLTTVLWDNDYAQTVPFADGTVDSDAFKVEFKYDNGICS